MELEPLLAILRRCARQNQGDENINILDECWHPFACPPDEEANSSHQRSIYLLNTLPLGRGTFGIVFAAVMVVGSHEGVKYYAPVALKMTPVLRDHISETVNGMALNELVWSGCTPGVARLMDAFCINGSLELCKMPPASWEGLWKAYDLFVYTKCEDIKRHYGDKSVYDINKETQTAHMSSGCTVGFLLTELSPYNLTTSVESMPTQRQPSINDVVNTKKILQGIYVKCQTLAAMHAANLLDLDIHSDNFIESMPITDRCNGFAIPLSPEDSQEDRASVYGPYHLSPQIRDQCYGFLMRTLPTASNPTRLAHDTRDNAVKIDCESIPLAIDFGSMRSAQVVYDKSPHQVREFVRETYFSKRTDIKNEDMPLYGFSHLQMQYKRGSSSAFALPLMIAVQSPTTNVITRAPEQMNPFVLHRPHPQNHEREEILGVGILSELTDVYSVMAVMVSDVIGFNPFSQQIPLCTVPSIADGSAAAPGPYRIGLEVHPRNIKQYKSTTEYKLSSVFGSALVESKRELGRSSASNYDLRRSSNNQPKKDYDIGKSHDYYIDDGHVKFASFVDPKTGLHNNGANNNGEARIVSLYEHIEAFIRTNAPKVRNYTRWIGYTEGKFDEAELAWTVRGLVARIEALGVPGPDECQGTFLYPLFRELERIYGALATRDGWLPDVLQRALTHRLGITGPEALDFLWLCRDALSWEPARRPPAHRILECPIFSHLYAPQATINTDPRRFWSAALPISDFWPQVHDETVALRSKKRPVTLEEAREMLGKDNISLMFAVTRSERSFLYDSMVSCLNMVKYWTFVRDFGRLPGFMTANSRSNYMPALHPGESREIAICNLNTGLLDYHTGTVCVNYIEGVTVMVHAEGLLANFNTRENVGFYCNTLVTSSQRTGILIPEWIFCNEEAFQELPIVALTERRRRLRDKFLAAGNSIEQLLPDYMTLDKILDNYTREHSVTKNGNNIPPQNPPPRIPEPPPKPLLNLALPSSTISEPMPGTPVFEDGELLENGSINLDKDEAKDRQSDRRALKRPHGDDERFERKTKPRVDSYRPNTDRSGFRDNHHHQDPVFRRPGPPPPRIDRDRFNPSSRSGFRGRFNNSRGRGGNRSLNQSNYVRHQDHTH